MNKLKIHEFEITFKSLKRAAFFAKLIGNTIPQIYQSLTGKKFPITLYASIETDGLSVYTDMVINPDSFSTETFEDEEVE